MAFGLISSNNATFRAKHNTDTLCYYAVKDKKLNILYFDTETATVRVWQTTEIVSDFISEHGNRIIKTENSFYCPAPWINTPYEEITEVCVLTRHLGLKAARAKADEISKNPVAVLEFLYKGVLK